MQINNQNQNQNQNLIDMISMISLFNVLAHRYQKHRKNDLIEAKLKSIVSFNITIISLTDDDPQCALNMFGACSVHTDWRRVVTDGGWMEGHLHVVRVFLSLGLWKTAITLKKQSK